VASYRMRGTLVEACNCDILCPCWVGEDPDNGTCDAVLAYHVEDGEIDGVDVSGLTWFGVTQIPGNVLEGNFRSLCFVDEGASDEQFEAMRAAFLGKLGGPLADLAQLVGELVGVERAPIDYGLEEGEGHVSVDGKVSARVAPYRSAAGDTTTLRDSIFSTIPGSAAWVGKASQMVVDIPEHGYQWRLEGKNAIQGEFAFEH